MLTSPFRFKRDTHNVELDNNKLKYNNTTQLTLVENGRPTVDLKTYSLISDQEIVSKKDVENRLLTFNPSGNSDQIKFNSSDTNKIQVYNG